MSLPQFEVQGSLFESLGAIAPELFADNDKYKLFGKKVLASAGAMPGATDGMLSSRQWTAWGGTGRAPWGLDFPVLM